VGSNLGDGRVVTAPMAFLRSMSGFYQRQVALIIGPLKFTLSMALPDFML
jgi:hypothetical protein